MTRAAPPTAAVLSVTYMPHVPHTLKRLLPGIFLDQVQINSVDRRFIQEQVGHRCDTSTAIYTHVSGDFMNTALRKALAPALAAGPASNGKEW